MGNVWFALVEGLEDLIRRFGLARLIIALSTVAAAVLALGIAISEEALLIATGVYLIVLLLFTCLALSLDRRRLYRLLGDASVVMDRYAAWLVERQTPDSFTIENWTEEIAVSRGGDAVIQRWFALVVGSEPLETFWHRCYKGVTPKPNSTAYQSKVRTSARLFSEIGDKKELGTRLPVTTTWSDHSLRTFVHFDDSQEPGSRVLVRLLIRWPGFYRELIDGEAVEPFEWTFRRKTEALQVEIEFSGDAGLKQHPFRVAAIGGRGVPQVEQKEGGARIRYSCEAPPKDQKFGFRLERARE